MESENAEVDRRVPWNKGKLTGQKPPLKLREILAIRTRLQMASNIRELAMFNLAIDSKLRACDLTRLQVQDFRHGSHVAVRATVMQQKTQRPVQFEITEQTRDSLEAWIEVRALKAADVLFLSRLHASPHLSTRQYARIVDRWIASIGLDDTAYGTHTMRRTKASLIYRRTKNLGAYSCSGIRSWKAQSAISASRSTMLLRSPSKLRFDASWPASGRLPASLGHSFLTRREAKASLQCQTAAVRLGARLTRCLPRAHRQYESG